MTKAESYEPSPLGEDCEFLGVLPDSPCSGKVLPVEEIETEDGSHCFLMVCEAHVMLVYS